jgi:hypothetical protein
MFSVAGGASSPPFALQTWSIFHGHGADEAAPAKGNG